MLVCRCGAVIYIYAPRQICPACGRKIRNGGGKYEAEKT